NTRNPAHSSGVFYCLKFSVLQPWLWFQLLPLDRFPFFVIAPAGLPNTRYLDVHLFIFKSPHSSLLLDLRVCNA
ncbi:hypothetical protein, partial [Aeromonas caviae]|uniref:hypothetical protein n=1 Tax=Aeromonas caviae TaxID=648 RepID=UPI002B482E12